MTNTPDDTDSPIPYQERAIIADVEDHVLTHVTLALERVMDRHRILALQAHELREAVRNGVETGVDVYSRKRAEKLLNEEAQA